MNPFLKRAQELREEIVANRRNIHRFGGVGFDLPETTAYVMEQLRALGLSPVGLCKSGVVCTIGSGGKTILLRADMDALPVEEESGLPFAATNGTMHACGHDMHAAMLLGAARLLVERQQELGGTVKLMFQPAEEILAGAEEMIRCGLLENPKVDAALGMHVGVGRPDSYSGLVTYIIGPASTSADEFCITVDTREKKGISPINVGCRIVQALQEVPSFEIRFHECFSLVCNVFQCNSTAANTLPTKVTIRGVLRTTSVENRDTGLRRIDEIVQGFCGSYGCQGTIEYVRSVGPMITDRDLCTQLAGYAQEIVGPEKMEQQPFGQGAEDFAAVCREVPGMFINLGAGHPSEGFTAANHKSTVLFNEEVLPTGAAIYANCAFQWLAAQREP